MVVVRDIAARKKTEAELREFNEELERQVQARTEELRNANAILEQRVRERTADLEQRNADLDAFTHSVSHDLRAPLRAMDGFARALSEDYCESLDEIGKEYLDHISDASRQMDMMIRELLAYSKLGQHELRLKAVPLEKTVRDTLKELSDVIELRNARVEIPDELPVILGHRSTVAQIVTNLISNALKFVAPDTNPHIRFSVTPIDDQTVRMVVEDNGIGIEAEYQTKIFEVFERLHGIESYPGTGIGLAIVSRACQRLGGNCGVDSEPGAGSRFWVEFKLAQANQPVQ